MSKPTTRSKSAKSEKVADGEGRHPDAPRPANLRLKPPAPVNGRYSFEYRRAGGGFMPISLPATVPGAALLHGARIVVKAGDPQGEFMKWLTGIS